MRGKDGRTDLTHQGAGQRILFTGPDGVGSHRARLCDFPRSVGVGALSPDATGDLNYLFRPAPGAPGALPKNCYVREVGWGTEHGFKLNARTLLSNNQIKHSEFRSAMEDRMSQIFQNPWLVPARSLDRQESSAPEDQSDQENRSQDPRSY